MELLTITLAANETKQFAKAGRYLEITDSSYAVRVDFIGDQGQQTDSMVNALSGLFIEDPFAAFAITNGATAQSVTFLILEMGRGGSRRQPGIVSVTNKISQAVTQFELNGGGLLPMSFLATVAVAPALNQRGLLVRRALVNATAGAGGTSEVRMIAAPVVPASSVPTNGFNMAQTSGAAGVPVIDAHVDQNYQLPAGWGVWVITNHTIAAAVVCGAAIVFEPL